MARYNLEDLMQQKGIKSINELSKRTGISRPTLTRWKDNEVNKIDLTTVKKVCEVLECEPSDLVVLDSKEKQVKRGTKSRD